MADPILLGLDVGGSSIKAALVDVARGVTTTPLHTVRTPLPSTPEQVLLSCAQIDRDLGAAGTVGLAFPAVVLRGQARTAANVDKSWIGYAGGERLAQLLGRPVIFLNDADAAGLAEVNAGAAVGVRGVVIVLTFGTGIGSGLFLDGRLVPNTELGHLELHGREAEAVAAARWRTQEQLEWPEWCARVNDYLARLYALFWPELFVIGGAISEDYAEFGHLLESPAEIRRAAHGAQAGVIGAAFAAAGLQQH